MSRQAAMISVPLAAPAAAAPMTGAVMCAVSLAVSASAMPLKLPKVSVPNVSLPKVSLPKLPEIDLPNFGGKKEKAAAKPASTRVPVAKGAKVRVRAATGVVATGSDDAPTLAEVTGESVQGSIEAGAGFKRFPNRRMPGANMDGWKKVAKDITPNM